MENAKPASKSRFRRLKPKCWMVSLFLFLAYCAHENDYNSADLEFNGYCKADGKTYDPYTLTNKVIEEWVLPRQKEKGEGYIQYASLQEFYEKNPRCCEFYTWNNPERNSLRMQRWERYYFPNKYYYQLSLYYNATQKDTKQYLFQQLIVNQCGKVVALHMETKESFYDPLNIRGKHILYITGHRNK